MKKDAFLLNIAIILLLVACGGSSDPVDQSHNSSTNNSCCYYPSGCYKSNYCIYSNNVVIRSEYIYFGIRFKKRTKQGNLIF